MVLPVQEDGRGTIQRQAGVAMRAHVVALAGLLALASPAMAALDADPAAIRRSAETVASRLGLQTDLPLDRPDIEERRPDPSGARFQIPAAQLLLFAALAVCLGLVLYSLRDRLPRLGKPRLKAQTPEALAEAAAVERMAETRQEADELAASGRYAEAMHALLMRGLAEMRRRLGVEFADSLTSREILRAVRLVPAGRQGLADLIRRVEFVHFGLHPAGRDDYAACLASYEALAGAVRGGASA